MLVSFLCIIYKNTKKLKWKMAPKIKTNCTKYVKLLKISKDNLACSKCENSQMPKIKSKRILKIQKRKNEIYLPILHWLHLIKCDRHDEHGQKGVLCTGCNLWINQKCAGITKAEYQNIGNNKEIPGYCTPCKINMFPFYGLKLVSTIFK